MSGRVTECKQVEVEGKKQMKLTLVPDARLQKAFKITKATYWYDIDKDIVVKVETDFSRKHQVKCLTMFYKGMDLNYKYKMEEFVSDLVVNKNQKLISKYKKYQLVDNR